MEIIAEIDDLRKVMHVYFFHTPKKYVELHYFALLMETKGLKLLKNVCTTWYSLISPLKQVLTKYPALMTKMYAHKDEKKWHKEASLGF